MPKKKAAPKPRDIARAVNAYIAAQPPAARRMMKLMRSTIAAAAPGAKPGFTYRIPGFRVDDKPLVWYAAFKRHCSLYPITADLQARHAKEIGTRKTARGTVQFPLDEPLPVSLVRKLVKGRLAALWADR